MKLLNMRRSSRVLALVTVGALASVALAACSSSDSKEDSSGSTVTLQVGDTLAGSPWVAGLDELADRVETETEGRVKIEVLPGPQLGGEIDMVNQVKQGTLAMAQVGNPGYPELSPLFTPYLFDDAKVMEFTKSDIYQGWKDSILQREGVRILGTQYYPARQITSNDPIESPADLEGMKIRVPEIASLVAAFEEYGASPQALPVTDIYLGLQNGTITAQENPLSTSASYKVNEVQKYVAMTYHAQTFRYLLINEGIWQSISEEDRTTIENAFNEIATDVEQKVREADNQILADFESQGIKVTNPDLKPFIELSADAGRSEADAAWGPGVLDQIRSEYGPKYVVRLH